MGTLMAAMMHTGIHTTTGFVRVVSAMTSKPSRFGDKKANLAFENWRAE